ncbi:hypothetical protein [Hahella ganghwensis]|uniref:hypothetical protein n=1 Tax=Hahella ganghwensis TaxID=286420 RepID=UPI00035D3242|nr:hypothetical protein [Hahella ganghwensis]
MKKLFFVFGVVVGIFALIKFMGGDASAGSEAYQAGSNAGQIFMMLFGLACAWRLYKGE